MEKNSFNSGLTDEEKSQPRILKASEVKTASPWQLPNMGPVTSAPKTVGKDSIEANGQQSQAGYEAGFKRGEQAGFEAGLARAMEQQQQSFKQMQMLFDQVIDALNEPFKQLDDQVEQELVTLVISMVRQLVRREVQTDSGLLIGVVREALGILPVSARDVRIVLNPDDVEMIREIYKLGDAEQTWRIEEDPMMDRGGCRVITDTSQIDATLESRINKLLAPLLAGQRQKDLS